MPAQSFGDFPAIGAVHLAIGEPREQRSRVGSRRATEPFDQRIAHGAARFEEHRFDQLRGLVAAARERARERNSNRRSIFGGRLGQPLEKPRHAPLPGRELQRKSGVKPNASIVVAKRRQERLVLTGGAQRSHRVDGRQTQPGCLALRKRN